MSSQSPSTRRIPADAHSMVFPDRCVYCEKPRETFLPLDADVKKSLTSSTSGENIPLETLCYQLQVPYCGRCAQLSRRNENVLLVTFLVSLLLFGGLTIFLVVTNWDAIAVALAKGISDVPLVHAPRPTPSPRNPTGASGQQGMAALANIGILIVVGALILSFPFMVVGMSAVLTTWLLKLILSRFDKSFWHTPFGGHLGIETAQCIDELVLTFINKHVAKEFAESNKGTFDKSGRVSIPISEIREKNATGGG